VIALAETHASDSPHLILVDIGNSNVSIATFSDGKRSDVDHLPTQPFEPVAACLRDRWTALQADAERAMVVSSVCPSVLKQLRAACAASDIDTVLAIGEELDLPIGTDLPEPDKVGSDRLCAAAGAYAKVKAACVVADFGTALTIDLVADNGVFLGGTILPGLALSARALHEHTALLPLVELGAEAPTTILGKDTRSAVRNGIHAMVVGTLREVTERYATEIGKWPPLILTGGDGLMIGKTCDFVDGYLPDLCLDGLVIAYQRAVAGDDDDADETTDE